MFTPEFLEKYGVKMKNEARTVIYEAFGGKVFWEQTPNDEKVYFLDQNAPRGTRPPLMLREELIKKKPEFFQLQKPFLRPEFV